MPKIPADDMNLKGSEDPRLCGDTDRRLNSRIGGLPRGRIRETNSGCVYAGPTDAVRRRLAGLRERFSKGKY